MALDIDLQGGRRFVLMAEFQGATVPCMHGGSPQGSGRDAQCSVTGRGIPRAIERDREGERERGGGGRGREGERERGREGERGGEREGEREGSTATQVRVRMCVTVIKTRTTGRPCVRSGKYRGTSIIRNITQPRTTIGPCA